MKKVRTFICTVEIFFIEGTVKIILKRKKDGKAILPPIEKPLLLLVENLLKTETWKEAWGDVVKIEKMADVLHRNSQVSQFHKLIQLGSEQPSRCKFGISKGFYGEL